MRVLYVEDNSFDAELTQRELKKLAPDIELELIGTLEKAIHRINRFSEESYDLVLCDLRLPDGDGLSVLAHIRENAIPVGGIIITGSGDEETVVAVLKAGADDYVVKRSDYLQHLPDVIRLAIKRQQIEKTRRSKVIRVLYAEHNVTDIDLTRRHLARLAPHIALVPVMEGSRALELLAQPDSDVAYQLALLDYRLPGMTGLETLKAIRQELKLDIPVVMISGHGNEEIALQAIKLGATDYLIKNPGYLLQLPFIIENAYHSWLANRERMALEESERRYRLIAEHAQDVIYKFRTFPEFAVEYLSPAMLSLTGLPPDEFYKHPELIEKLTFSEDRILYQQAMTGALSTLDQIVFRISDIHQNLKWVEIRGALINDAQGRLVALEGIARDVTSRIKTDEELQLLSAGLEAAANGIMVTDHTGVIIWVNPAFSQLTGFSLDEAVGQKPSILRSGMNSEEFYRNLWETIGSGNVWRGELVNRHKNGNFYNEEMTITPVCDKDGEITHYIAIKQDITERKKSEAQNIALMNKIQKNLIEIETINRVSSAVRAANTMDEILSALLDQTMATLNATAGGIWLYNPVIRRLERDITRGWFSIIDDYPTAPGEGVIGKVFVEGKSYQFDDFLTDQILKPNVMKQSPSGFGGIAYPIRTSTEIVGAMLIAIHQPVEISADDLNFLDTLSEIGGSSIHRLRLFNQTEQRLRRLTALRLTEAAIASSLDLNLILDILLETVSNQLGIDAASVRLLNNRSLELRFAAGKGFFTHNFENLNVRLGDFPAGKTALERKPMVLLNLAQSQEDFYPFQVVADENFSSYIAIPLVSKGQIKGVLEIFNRSLLEPDEEWLNFLETLSNQAAMALDNASLVEGLQRTNLELGLAYDATIEGWSRALELRDRETKGHAVRVNLLTLRLARAMGIREEELIHIRRGALLHDIGKMGIPDAILNKPGQLNKEEWAIMRSHPTLAHDLLAPIPFLAPALDIPFAHHERWNGSGYPRGLKGEEIPLAARIFAVVDVWDALRSNRPYRSSWPEDKVIQYMKEQENIQFDPAVVEVFINMINSDH